MAGSSTATQISVSKEFQKGGQNLTAAHSVSSQLTSEPVLVPSQNIGNFCMCSLLPKWGVVKM